MQRNIIASALQSQQRARIPWQLKVFVRIPILRDLPVRLMMLGIRRVRLAEP